MNLRKQQILTLLLILTFSAFLFVGCSNTQGSSGTEGTNNNGTRTKSATPKIIVPENTTEISAGQVIALKTEGFGDETRWVSSDPYAVSVGEKGSVKGGHKSGSVTITATNGEQSAQVTLTNKVTMRDISSAELVKEMTFGGDWNDQVTIIKREVSEITSMPINVGFTIWEDQNPISIFGEGKPVMKGQTISQKIVLPEISGEVAHAKLSKASLNFWYAGDSSEEQGIIVNVSNAKLAVNDKVYELPYMNGKHTLEMYSNQDPTNGQWFCGGAIGDLNQSGLPLPKDLEGGVFSADITLEKFKSDFRDVQRYLCASTGGDVPLTREMILEAKNAGYDFLRVPFTFSNFMNEDFVIQDAYLDELEQVVNLVLDACLYCLIDSSEDYMKVSWVGDHYDENWLAEKYRDYVNTRYQAAWRQIAERFKDYDDFLLFGNFNEFNGNDGMENEVHYEGSRFALGNYETQRLNEMTQLFVDTVTATGSNNEKRHLYIAGWNGSWEKNVLDALELPDYDRIIGSVHYYYYENWGDENISSWTSSKSTDTAQVNLMFNNLKERFIDRGIPVIITEFGTRERLPMADRIDQATYILKKAIALGIPCTWFEGGGWFNWENGESIALFDRNKMTWQYPELVKAMQDLYLSK